MFRLQLGGLDLRFARLIRKAALAPQALLGISVRQRAHIIGVAADDTLIAGYGLLANSEAVMIWAMLIAML